MKGQQIKLPPVAETPAKGTKKASLRGNEIYTDFKVIYRLIKTSLMHLRKLVSTKVICLAYYDYRPPELYKKIKVKPPPAKVYSHHSHNV
jgi:hypothetical protein